MKIKNKIIVGIVCLIIGVFFFIVESYQYINSDVKKVYNVYLDGKIIGAIDDKDGLYNLINEKQQGIKDKYAVNNVFPPSSLKLVENYSYNTEICR